MTDVEGSTRRWDRSPSAMALAIRQHDDIVNAEVQAHGGALVELGREGDSVSAAFGSARAAVLAAVAVQRKISEATWPVDGALRMRIAVHTGEAEPRGSHYFGLPWYRCARLLNIAVGGQTVISAATFELIADDVPTGLLLVDLGVHALRDLGRPEHVHKVESRAAPTLGSGLSKREIEVAGLLADGLTNREIAQKLFISERTAEGHVERIRNKLQVRSRAGVAVWMATRKRSVDLTLAPEHSLRQ